MQSMAELVRDLGTIDVLAMFENDVRAQTVILSDRPLDRRPYDWKKEQMCSTFPFLNDILISFLDSEMFYAKRGWYPVAPFTNMV